MVVNSDNEDLASEYVVVMSGFGVEVVVLKEMVVGIVTCRGGGHYVGKLEIKV